ncbi:hypothetical protein C8R44DRAFT_893635 [Mycena epipterygia]|nr:hypothetical protein C8R44DRAFT_893635 [Mycena epipterygia]
MSSSNQTHGLRALRVRHLAAIRRICNVGHQAIALRAAREPYHNEGPGTLYANLRLVPDLLSAYRAGTLSPADLSPALSPHHFQVKIGHTNDVRRRRPEYRRCAEGQFLHWHAYFPVARRKLAERLTHLRLQAAGARVRRRRCPGPRCRIRHCEYYSLSAAGGLRGVEDIVQQVVLSIGGVYERVLLSRRVPRAAGLAPAAFGSGDPPPPAPGAPPALLDSLQHRFGTGKEESPSPARGEVPPRCWTKSSSVRERGSSPPPAPVLPPRCWIRSSSVSERGKRNPPSLLRGKFPRAAGLSPAASVRERGSSPTAPGAFPALLNSLQQRFGTGKVPRAAELAPAAFGSGDPPPCPRCFPRAAGFAPAAFRSGKEESPLPRSGGRSPALLDSLQQRSGAEILLPLPPALSPRCWTKSSSVWERGSSPPGSRCFPRPAGLAPAAFRSGEGGNPPSPLRGKFPRAAGLSPAAFGNGDPFPPPLPVLPHALDSLQQRFGASNPAPAPAPRLPPPDPIRSDSPRTPIRSDSSRGPAGTRPGLKYQSA